ncbi:MAG: 4Fe-4S binding protein [Candidatus Aminicenantes bacterium]|nr:4Fe-4S binding protein [Candidatus Aminicenantes bacterium]
MKLLTKRPWFQAISTIALNAYFPAWIKGGIYQGNAKGICVPVLNCYSCPAALGACPIGALQNFFASLRFNLSIAQYQFGLYVIGLMGAVGSVAGRIPCGWMCPFGLLQDLLYKIKTPKIRIPYFLSYLKYIILVLMVFILPLLIVDDFGFGQTWFCKWICPAGTLEAGIPLAALDSSIRSQIGFLFNWKIGILFIFLVWMVVSKRPFCRLFCPLGAILGLFNRISFFRMVVDDEKCTRCNQCLQDCPVDIKIYESPNSPECIRCMKCITVCPYGAIDHEFMKSKTKERVSEV